MTKQGKKSVRRYIARKVWGGFVNLIKVSPKILLVLACWIGLVYARAYHQTAFIIVGGTLIGLVVLGFVALCIIALYREARRECGYDQD